MLRESATSNGMQVNLDGISDPDCKRIDDVLHSEALIRFCDTFLGGDEEAFSEARAVLVAQMGEAAMVDAAGVVSNFQRMDRIADSTGIPSDAPMMIEQQEFVDQLSLDKYVSAGNTPKMPWLKRMFFKYVVLRNGISELYRQRIDGS